MIPLPALAEKDAAHALEGEFGAPVALVTPGGVKIDKTADGKPLKGFVRRSYTETRNAGRGEKGGDRVTVNAPAVKLRITSLAETPATGEAWLVGIPESPREGSSLEWYGLDPKKPVEANVGAGTVKLYLAKMREGAA